MSKKIHVGVACGGYSSEREVSLRSGKKVAGALTRLGYHVSVIDPITDLDALLSVSIVFNLVHGAYGEDGTLHAFLEHYNIPYVGSPPVASIMSMNKAMTKQLLTLNSIPTPNYYVAFTALTTLPKPFLYPVFLKPISGGSSIDTFYVNNPNDLHLYSTQLYTQYHHYLLESFIKGTEVTVGVIDHPKLISLPVLELRPKGSFYDYHSKYTDGMTDFVIPANLTNNQTKRCQELALKTHEVVGCSGFSRTDMIVNESGPHVLEINSLPGMTDLSDLPAQAQAYGLSYDELVDSLVKSAL